MATYVHSYGDAKDLFKKVRNVEAGKPLQNHTRLHKFAYCGKHWSPDSVFAVRYHNTNVVMYYADGVVELNSGGYRTPSTRDRINSNVPSGVGISQVEGEWEITIQRFWQSPDGGRYLKYFEYSFDDGMLIHPDFTVTGVELPQPVTEFPNRPGLANLLALHSLEVYKTKRAKLAQGYYYQIGRRGFDPSMSDKANVAIAYEHSTLKSWTKIVTEHFI